MTYKYFEINFSKIETKNAAITLAKSSIFDEKIGELKRNICVYLGLFWYLFTIIYDKDEDN